MMYLFFKYSGLELYSGINISLLLLQDNSKSIPEMNMLSILHSFSEVTIFIFTDNTSVTSRQKQIFQNSYRITNHVVDTTQQFSCIEVRKRKEKEFLFSISVYTDKKIRSLINL